MLIIDEILLIGFGVIPVLSYSCTNSMNNKIGKESTSEELKELKFGNFQTVDKALKVPGKIIKIGNI